MDEPASNTTTTAQAMESVNGSIKRKRSASPEAPAAPAPPTKAAKTHGSHLQINYLARQYSDVLPMISERDTMPSIIQTLQDYGGVVERHESLAGNMGAKPLGPMIMKRFDRLFDGNPKVLKSHGKEGTTVTWLDVVEFARHKPEQFNLEKMRDGVRVCQFYTKQSRVEISEEDFLLISSGMPQKLIPPQPIAEDEEKELGTLELLEKSLTAVTQLADQVSARARQTKHRLTARKNAIASRREAEASEAAQLSLSGKDDDGSGFTAVNRTAFNGPASSSTGKSYTGATASPTTKAELIHCFNQQRERLHESATAETLTSVAASTSRTTHSHKKKAATSENIDYAGILLNSASPVPIPSTPSSLVTYPRPTQAERYDDSGPYKAEMLSRMDSMQRGDRVMPPCDRCRRLHMDCLKNLTACQGCTRKHAKCSWKDVTEQELLDNPHPRGTRGASAGSGKEVEGEGEPEEEVDPQQPVRDEELLGEEDSEDEGDVIMGGLAERNTVEAGKVEEAESPLGGDGGPVASRARDEVVVNTIVKAPEASMGGMSDSEVVAKTNEVLAKRVGIPKISGLDGAVDEPQTEPELEPEVVEKQERMDASLIQDAVDETMADVKEHFGEVERNGNSGFASVNGVGA